MKLSYIEEDEKEEAKNIINKTFSFDLPILCNKNILVKIYVRDEEIKKIIDKNGNEIKLYWPDFVREKDKFTNCAALVLGISENIKEEDLSYRIGDFISIPRNEGIQINYKGNIFHILKANKVFSILKEPEFLERKKNVSIK